MSWLNLNQSLNSLKGQITNFASEVLSEGIVEDSNETYTEIERANLKIKELSEKCINQDQEITALKKLNDDLQTSLHAEKFRKNGIQQTSVEDDTWFWDPPPPNPIKNPPGTSINPMLPQSAETQQIIYLQNKITDLKQKLNPENSEVEILKTENSILKTKLQELEERNSLKTDEHSLKNELQALDSLKTENAMLKNKLQDLMQDTSQNKLTEEVDETKTLINKLKNELEAFDNVKMENDVLKIKLQAVEEMKSENATLKNELQEIDSLKTENANLKLSLDELDNQHQQAMSKLLHLKKELQKNFELLKVEHEDLKNSNDEYQNEISDLKVKLEEKAGELQKLETVQTDLDTLQHKYYNLEKVHSILQEQAEKFQEENQELHEEVFKLQEEVTKLQHEVEITSNNKTAHISADKYEALVKEFEDFKEKVQTIKPIPQTVNKEAYDALVQELNEIKTKKNSFNPELLEDLNIDDNAKSLIESLRRKIVDLEKNNVAYGSEKLMDMYNKYVNFEIQIDAVGETPSEDVAFVKIENALKILNALKKEIDVLQHKLSEKTLNEKHLQTQIDDITSENEYLTADINHYERELSEMKKNNDFLISEIAALKNSSKLEPIIETHEDNLAKLETELAVSNDKNKLFSNEIHAIKTKLKEVAHEKLILQKDLNDVKEKYAQMAIQLDAYKNKASQVENIEVEHIYEHKEKLQQAQDMIDDLKRKISTTNSKNEQLNIDVHILENDKVLLTSKLEEIKSALNAKEMTHKEAFEIKNSLEQKLNELSEKLRQVMNDKDEIETNRRHLIEKINILATEVFDTDCNDKLNNINANSDKYIEAIKTKLTAHKTLENDMQKHVKEIETLKNELSIKHTKLHRVNDENEQLRNEIALINAAFEQAKGNEKDLILKLKNVNSVNETLVRNASALKEEINDLRFKLKTADDTAKELEEFRVANKKLLFTNAQLESEASSVNNRQMNFDKRLEKAMEDLKKKDEDIFKINQKKQALRSDVAMLTGTIKDLEFKINSQDKEIDKLTGQLKHLNKDCGLPEKENEIKKMVEFKEHLEKDVKRLQKDLHVKETEVTELQKKLKHIEDVELANRNELVEKMNKEKNDLIKLINVKHNESLQYHNEIQRLNKVILDENEKFINILKEKKRLEELIAKTDDDNMKCSNCDKIKFDLHENEIKLKKANDKLEEFDLKKSELQNATEIIKNLTQKCEDLDRNLTIQSDAVSKLSLENSQLSELKENATREVERLRRHLMETEERYTAELVSAENKLSEAQSQLRHVEERAKQSSTVYTSSSIRANQEVETLRTQVRLLEKQREEARDKLLAVEEGSARSQASIANLQLALEQFQQEKERDIQAATEKIYNQMSRLNSTKQDLENQVEKLKGKLEESAQGLKAAHRLGDQLEAKTAQINDLKEQVAILEASLKASEERYHKSISNQQDKIDKSLVKNLVLNLIQGGHNSEVLRILSTVLDFNAEDCAKAGLRSNAAPTPGLAREFVRFLEQESKPRPQNQVKPPSTPWPNMTTRSSPAPQPSPGPTHSPTPSLGHARTSSSGSNNLLFQHIEGIEPNTQLQQHRNTEGAILKAVLRDNQE